MKIRMILGLMIGGFLVTGTVFAWMEESVSCDEQYDKCYEVARKNVESCGTLKDCNVRYIAAKKKCEADFEICEARAKKK